MNSQESNSASSSSSLDYVGDELTLFQHAHRWKKYFGKFFRPHLTGKDDLQVLEVGAGMGGTTSHLCDGSQSKWICLEPDPELIAILDQKIQSKELSPCCESRLGILQDIPEGPHFDAILYVDVLEHIEHDAREIEDAGKRLRPGGMILTLSPAHNWLYSPFDKAIGHFRRYNKPLLRALTSQGLHLDTLRYLDSVGVMASAANRFLMKQGMPTASQIQTWDRWMVPLSRGCDPLTFYGVGKSILAFWRKT